VILRAFVSLAVVVAAGLSWATEPLVEKENLYVGAIVCKTCHGPTQAHDSFTVWSVSKHSRTFVQLGTGYIEMIDPDAKGFVPEGFGGSIVREAQRLGIDTDCLQCHTTAHNLANENKAETFHLEDGVQCEACHGPGGAHVAWMENGADDSRPESSRMARSSIDDCAQTCHRRKPTHEAVMTIEFDPEKAWKKIAHGAAAE